MKCRDSPSLPSRNMSVQLLTGEGGSSLRTCFYSLWFLYPRTLLSICFLQDARRRFPISSFAGPNAPPSNIQGHNTSSTSILVQWGDVPSADQNGVILSYTVTYKALPDGSPQTKVVSSPTTEVTLTDLNEYTNYSITVFASTIRGGGLVSDPTFVVTAQDSKFHSSFFVVELFVMLLYFQTFYLSCGIGPSASPANLRAYIRNATSIFVEWGNVPAADQNGVILSYTVTYMALPNGSPQTKLLSALTNEVILTGLNENTNYSITVFASTAMGDGNMSLPVIVRTGYNCKYALTKFNEIH